MKEMLHRLYNLFFSKQGVRVRCSNPKCDKKEFIITAEERDRYFLRTVRSITKNYPCPGCGGEVYMVSREDADSPLGLVEETQYKDNNSNN